MAEALGEMGLHPWEFREYFFDEFLWKRAGIQNLQIEELQKVRLICFFAASGNLKRGTRIEQLFPLPGDKNYKRRMTTERYKELKGVLSQLKPPDLSKRKKNVGGTET